MTHPAAVFELVDRARRRRTVNLFVKQFLLAVVVFLAAFCLLLILGSDVLTWYWPWLLGLAALAITGVRFWQRRPHSYQTVQDLDERLGSRDLLSTAWHFGQLPKERVPQSRFLDLVAAEADQEASRISLAEAIPWETPREMWFVLALVVASAALLMVRFGVLHTLDLRSSLVPVQFDSLTGLPVATEKRKGAPGDPNGQLPQPMALTVDPETQRPTEEPPILEDALQTVDVSEGNQTAMNTKSGEKKREGAKSGEQGDEAGETAEEGDPSENPGAASEDPNSPPGEKKGSSGAKDKKQPPQESNSLLDKMRDAFANLMDKMNMQPKSDEGQQTASKGESKQSEGQRMDQKGQPGQSKSQSKAESDADAEANQKGETSDQAQGNKSSQGEKAEQPSNEARSGMGKQDGAKDTELADQLEAMGKISEILGKRSNSLNGEMMVEVQNSKQQALKTPYLNRKATHSEAGGEINRDEVPLHLHQYVQQYYEQVRKGNPTPAPATPAPSPAPAKP